jgi:hypothetical protein
MKSCGLGGLGGGDDGLAAGALEAVGDVVRDRAVEEEHVLADQPDGGAQRAQVEVAQIVAVERDDARGRLVEA